MKKRCMPRSWICALLFAANAFSANAAPAKQVIDPFGLNENTLPALEANKRKQIEAAKSWKAFHNFTFSDQYDTSGIRFEQQPVDDAAKDYMAVHYDHGTGMAVADVDGDGHLDIYFVNQLSGNQLYRNRGNGKVENVTAATG